jgi:hypothetical protein
MFITFYAYHKYKSLAKVSHFLCINIIKIVGKLKEHIFLKNYPMTKLLHMVSSSNFSIIDSLTLIILFGVSKYKCS